MAVPPWTQRWIEVPDVAMPKSGARPAIVRQPKLGHERARGARIGDPDLHDIARCEADRDVPVGIDDRPGNRRQQGQSAVGEPALGDTVEIECDAAGSLDDGRAAAARQAP